MSKSGVETEETWSNLPCVNHKEHNLELVESLKLVHGSGVSIL